MSAGDAAGGSVLRGTSSTSRTLCQRELAALRPAVPGPARPRKAPVPAAQVTSGIACFCGERFALAQALEFMIHLRAEVGADLARLERQREYYRERDRERRKDPEWRERERERDRERWKDPEWRARKRERDRELRKDPEYRARMNEYQRERRRAKREAAQRAAAPDVAP